MRPDCTARAVMRRLSAVTMSVVAPLVLFVTAGAANERIPIKIVVPNASVDDRSSLKIVAKPISGGSELGFELSPSGGTVELPAGVWSLSAVESGKWFPERLVVIQEATEVLLRSFRTVATKVFPQAPSGTKLPPALDATFVVNQVGDEPTTGETTCAMADVPNQWVCDLPAAQIDLQLAASGFATTYLWDLQPTGTDSPTRIRLHGGGSIVAWVERGTADKPNGAVQVSLEPLLVQASEGKEPIKRAFAEPSPRGFVQFFDLRPGRYLLVAQKRGSADVKLAVEVRDGETRVQDPLILVAPAALEVSIEPRQLDARTPWTVEIAPLDEIRESPVHLRPRGPGKWAAEGFGAGRYLLSVAAGADNRYWAEQIDLMPGAVRRLRVDLPLSTVNGRVSIGEKPLGFATLRFGGLLSPSSVTTSADASGSFSVPLPRSGKWTVEVEAKDPHVHGEVGVEATEGFLDIRLPNRALRGIVKDGVGSPVVADVRALPDGPDAAVLTASSDQDGRFEFFGLPAGAITVSASTGTGQKSTPKRVEIDAATDREVELVVGDPRSFAVRVIGPDGAIAGARILVFPLPPAGPTRPVMTDQDGRAEVTMPPGTSEIAVAVSAPGYPYTMKKMSVVGDEILLLLESGKGTLRITLPDSISAPEVFVLHEGGFSGLLALERWARQGGATSSQSDRVVTIPEMAPGPYTVCRGGRAELQFALGVVAPQRCVTGSLAPDSLLDLNLGEASR